MIAMNETTNDDVSMEPIKKFVELAERKRKIKDELYAVEQDLKELSQQCENILDHHNIATIKMNGWYVYKKRNLRTRFKVPGPTGASILMAHGYGDCVTVNSSAIKAKCREMMSVDDNKGWEFIPDSIDDCIKEVIDVYESYTLEAR